MEIGFIRSTVALRALASHIVVLAEARQHFRKLGEERVISLALRALVGVLAMMALLICHDTFSSQQSTSYQIDLG